MSLKPEEGEKSSRLREIEQKKETEMYFKFINIIGWGKCNPQVEVVDRKRCNLISIPEDAVRSARSLKESFQMDQFSNFSNNF